MLCIAHHIVTTIHVIGNLRARIAHRPGDPAHRRVDVPLAGRAQGVLLYATPRCAHDLDVAVRERRTYSVPVFDQRFASFGIL
jgi:hypothetical protein